MCGRYRLARKKEILAEVFDVGDDVDWSPRYNIAPSQSAPVVRQDATRPVRSFSLIRWGLIPFWAKEAKAAYKMINARGLFRHFRGEQLQRRVERKRARLIGLD